MWTVRRCWLAKHPVRWHGRNPLRRRGQPGPDGKRRARGDRSDWLDTYDFYHPFAEDNPFAALVAVAVILVLAVLGWFFLVPLILAIIDLTILLLLTVAGIAARTVLRRPWEIEALAPDGRRLTWQVVGWNRSRRAITAVATRLRQGEIPPTDSANLPPT